jgi:hypothetical protein
MRYRVEITEEPRHKVMIEDLPQAKMGAQVNYSLFNKLAAIGGAAMKMSEPDRKATKTITKVPREAANLEAEGGETVLTFDPTGFPLFYTIKGPRHHSGGVPLNLPDDSFIFSDTKEMIIRDCTILKMFSKPCNKKGYTPADLSKQFDINKYRNMLQDPNTDEITRKTAESMIKKYVIKLGALALAQESKKGFPQGIPVVAQAYMDANGISEDDIMPQEPSPMAQGQGQMSPTDQMPPDQYAQEPQPDGMQNASPDQMDEQQMQQMMTAQQQQGQRQAPQQGGVPEGAATPEMMEGMMQQMEQQQPMGRYGMAMNSPMAMYGMEMGGFYPEYAFGGFPRFDGGGTTRPTNTTKVGNTDYKNSTWETRSDAQGEYKYTKEKGNVEGRQEYSREHAPGGGGGGGFKGSLCNDMKTKGRTHYGKTAEEVVKYAFGHHYNADGSLNPKWAKVNAQEIAKLKGCEVAGARETEKAIYTETGSTTKCPDCIDPITGQAVTTGPDGAPFTRTKDANGNCTPCPTKECFCEDENGNQITVDCNDPCTKEQKQEEYYGESNQGTQVQNLPEDELALWADLGYRQGEMRPEYMNPAGVQLEQYGIDPRAEANAAGAVTNKIIENQGQFSQNPGGTLANQLMAQATGAQMIDAAFNKAAQFNVPVRNQEIQTNTAYRKDFLDKRPLYAQDYLGKVAKYKENDAKFHNEKLGRFVQDYRTMKGNARDMALINAGSENVKFDPRSNSVYTVKTKDFTPTMSSADVAQRTKDIMHTYGIEDENVAYKLATTARFGGQYAKGGFVYTDNIFPYLL